MTYPGAWEQLDNFTVEGERKRWDDGTTDFLGQKVAGTYSGNALSDLQDADAALDTAAFSPAASSNIRKAASVALGNVSGDKSKGAKRAGPVSLAPPSSIVPTPWPDGAVGYEWQTPNGQPVAAYARVYQSSPTLNFEGTTGTWWLRASACSDSADPPTFLNEITTLAEWDNDNTPATTPYIDVTLAMAEGTGNFVIGGEADWSVVTATEPGVSSSGTGIAVALQADIRAAAGSIPGFNVKYDVRPPLFRWLYNTPQAPPGLPPLRQFPRRDGLGASTARRHYPPDRSVQASNRRAGGYY